jgi:hypothetical protein
MGGPTTGAGQKLPPKPSRTSFRFIPVYLVQSVHSPRKSPIRFCLCVRGHHDWPAKRVSRPVAQAGGIQVHRDHAWDTRWRIIGFHTADTERPEQPGRLAVLFRMIFNGRPTSAVAGSLPGARARQDRTEGQNGRPPGCRSTQTGNNSSWPKPGWSRS